MSTSLFDSGGSGGDDDTTDDDGGHSDGTMYTGSDSADEGTDLSKRAILAALGISGTVWAFLVGFAEDPVGTIRGILKDIIYEDLLLPAGEAVWDAGVAVLDAFVVLIVGSDHQIGVSVGSSYGLLDIPFAFTSPLAASITGTGDMLIGMVEAANQAAAAEIASFGIAAPFVMTTLWVGEVVVAGWIVWIIISAIDIPAIRVVGFLKAATAPLRRLLGLFK